MYKILYLPTRYFPSISGAEFYLQRISEILKSNYDYNISIFCSNAIDFKALRDPKGKTINSNDKHYKEVNNLMINRFSIDYEISMDEKIKNLKKIDVYNALNLSDNCLKELLKNGPYLGDLIDYFLKSENLKYELIHTTFYPYFNIIIALIVGKLLKVPIVITPFYHFSNPRYSEKTITEVLTKFDLIIACTNIEKNFISENLKIPEEKIIIIPMGVDYNIFEEVHETKLKNYYFKQKFFKTHENKYKMVLFCGYKNYEKGSISILKAIPYVLEKIKKVYFVFIGPPTMAFNRELSKIKKNHNARIINFTPDNLTGYYDKKKISAFQEADVFIMPSRSDAFGIAYLEAWAAGKPVIGANIGATPEVIRDNIDGLLVEFDSPKDIAEKVIKLLKNKRLRKKFGEAGKLRVFQNYTWDIVAEKTHKIYQPLIRKNY